MLSEAQTWELIRPLLRRIAGPTTSNFDHVPFATAFQCNVRLRDYSPQAVQHLRQYVDDLVPAVSNREIGDVEPLLGEGLHLFNAHVCDASGPPGHPVRRLKSDRRRIRGGLLCGTWDGWRWHRARRRFRDLPVHLARQRQGRGMAGLRLGRADGRPGCCRAGVGNSNGNTAGGHCWAGGQGEVMPRRATSAGDWNLWMNIALWVLPIPLCRLALLGVRWQRVWR
mmetsp:Transcript_80336/g.134281  ORF Transcript_80336/g.134281 Transcript_80336/m.134281 type:complete len:225 (+) Transcript_80336:278-952(+)